MHQPPDSPFRVAFDGQPDWPRAHRPPADAPGRKDLKRQLADEIERMRPLHRKLYADDRFSVLVVFQALDAAGKDGTIRAVFSGLNPAGCAVHSFKKPSSNELDQDFLWRCSQRAPQRGRIGVFNRSYYEEVLVVRVHPELLQYQRLPDAEPTPAFWAERMESIRSFERHLASQGTVILKFFLNVSRQEQAERLVARIDDPDKNWKFEPGDVKERAFWGDYQDAFRDALGETSRPWAPWYAIPADDKPFMRLQVARTLRRTLESLPLQWPAPDADALAGLQRWRDQLTRDGDGA